MAQAEPAAPVAPAPAAQFKDVPEDNTVYSFQADNLDVRAALATFARANNLNIVPDNDITGTVTVDVRNLPLKQMMRALLEASDCVWQEERRADPRSQHRNPHVHRGLPAALPQRPRPELRYPGLRQRRMAVAWVAAWAVAWAAVEAAWAVVQAEAWAAAEAVHQLRQFQRQCERR